MKYDVYAEIFADPEYSTFDFISEGRYGCIQKRITFTPTHWINVYNLAFGDITEGGDIDDFKISDNGDRNKILATIVKVVEAYTNKYPERWVYFTGNTDQRTRLYRMAVSLHLEELSTFFEIFAEINEKEEFVRFQKGLNINAFLVKRKFIKFEYEKESQNI